MSLPVFIHPDLSAARTGEAFSFSGPEARHAVTVKRMGEGERLELIDGTGDYSKFGNLDAYAHGAPLADVFDKKLGY